MTTDATLSEPSPEKDTPSYVAIHDRLRAHRSRARDYTCSCGRPAEDWAYLHNGEPELSEQRSEGIWVSYGADLWENYAPMCRKCHRNFDMVQQPEQFEYLWCDKRVDAFREMASRPKSLGHSAKIWEARKADPEGMEKHVEQVSSTMKRTNARKFKCLECGHVNNAGNMGIHRKKTGHTEREEVQS